MACADVLFDFGISKMAAVVLAIGEGCHPLLLAITNLVIFSFSFKMAMSGVGLCDGVVKTYDTKLKTKHLLDALVLSINKEEKRQIVAEHEFEAGTLPFEELKKILPPKEPRFVLYDYNYTTENEQKHSKIILVSW